MKGKIDVQWEFFGLPQHFLEILNSLAEYKRQLAKERHRLADLVATGQETEAVRESKKRIEKISSIINHFDGPVQEKARSRHYFFS